MVAINADIPSGASRRCADLRRSRSSGAAAWLQRAHGALMSQADAITDAALRQMFLTNIPHHREIVALWVRKQAES